jgi:acetyltransferase
VNPLLVWGDGAAALDARVIVDREALARPAKPYAHLALHPYPEEYVTATTLRDGTPVTLRPIRPEDEPRWMEMLGACSRDTIYARFRGFFRWDTHQAAVRFCYIDYDREMALVAEIEDEGRRRLVGVGRLVAAPDLESADYAVLVADPWQNQGLGGVFTDTCLEIARTWGVKQVLAETSTDNVRMQRVFEKRAFDMTTDRLGDTVLAVRDLAGGDRG